MGSERKTHAAAVEGAFIEGLVEFDLHIRDRAFKKARRKLVELKTPCRRPEPRNVTE